MEIALFEPSFLSTNNGLMKQSIAQLGHAIQSVFTKRPCIPSSHSSKKNVHICKLNLSVSLAEQRKVEILGKYNA